MPAKTPAIADELAARLALLGQQIRARRKALGVNATAAAEAAGMSRVTWHRIEKGEPSVTAGAYVSAMSALALNFGILPSTAEQSGSALHDTRGWIPARIRLADYPELRRLAWHVHGTDTLTPLEAVGIYERNARHLDPQALTPTERDLIDALKLGLAQGRTDV